MYPIACNNDVCYKGTTLYLDGVGVKRIILGDFVDVYMY